MRLAACPFKRTTSELDRLLSRPYLWWPAVALVLLLQVALILTHWPWPDEYQALQLAVQAPDIPTLLEWLRYEGHPPLWYLLLRGLAHIAEPRDTLWLAALLIALPAQALILFASPFTRAERLMIALSEFMLFDFLTISRSTSLGVLVLLAAVALWRRRWAWAAIALLPFCDFLFGVLSGILVLLKLRERSLWWPGAAAWLVCGLAAAWTVRPAPNTVSAFDMLDMQSGPVAYFWKISGLLIPFQGAIHPQWNSPVAPVASFAWIGFALLCWFATSGDRFHRLLLFGFIALTFVFSLVVYPLGLRHLMLIALLLIALTWLARANGAAPATSFRAWLALIALCGLGTAGIALSRPFDTAHLAIAEIRSRGLQDKHWMIYPDWRVSGLTALSAMRFERPEQHCMLEFERWNYRTRLLDPQRLTAFLRREIDRHGKAYLVSDFDIAGVPRDVLQPLARIPAGYDGIPYNLYIVGPAAAEAPAKLPACVPERRPLARF